MWSGRLDSGESDDLRLWQVVKKFNKFDSKDGIVFTGYNSDDGVIRNLGRKGAADGPDSIRKACSSLPYVESFGALFDAGDINKFKLEDAQKDLADITLTALKSNCMPINLGGGHDIAYGTYTGVRKAFPEKTIGIINFDAHLDMRSYEEKPTSGTMFKQILDTDDNVNYMIIGYQNMGNTLRLRKLAQEKGVTICEVGEHLDSINNKLKQFLDRCDLVYTTFCMDVFDITEAPGVSAPSSIGLEKRIAMSVLKNIILSGKLKAVDFAEVNPSLDIDNRTARLVSNFIYKILEIKGGI